MNIFVALFSLLDHLWGGFNNRGSGADRRQRGLRKMERRAARCTRGITGCPLSHDNRLDSTNLCEVFLPDAQSVADAWEKLSKLNKEKTYSMILLLHWAAEQGKLGEVEFHPVK